MAELAKTIKFRPRSKRRDGGQEPGHFEIDGQEFPWYVTDDGVEVTSSRKELTIVTVKIPCERAEVIDTPWSKPEGG